MSNIHVEADKVINAPPATVYAVLADYRVGHPAILPKAYFKSLHVEQGGVGAGTDVITAMEIYGTKRTFRLAVTEPQPGRILAEEDPAAGTATTFTLDPVGDGNRTRVTITTDARVSPGFAGWIERMVNPFLMRKIYNAELQQLADYVAQPAP